MILVADSGSTKCDWVLASSDKKVKFQTVGLNPFFLSPKEIGSILNESLPPTQENISSVFFYGAGCSSSVYNSIVQEGIRAVLPNSHIQINHDLKGAAVATYQGRPSIACILGTGSNSCYFDGSQIHEKRPALGYILGDEGSGTYYGKILLKLFLYNDLPTDLQENFQSEYGLNKEIIFENVYQKPKANKYLASFAKFLSTYKTHPWVKEQVSEGMRDFMQTHILCFPEYNSVLAHFVGSIAFNFSEILRKEAKELNIEVGTILQKPINGLVEYHLVN